MGLFGFVLVERVDNIGQYIDLPVFDPEQLRVLVPLHHTIELHVVAVTRVIMLLTALIVGIGQVSGERRMVAGNVLDHLVVVFQFAVSDDFRCHAVKS